MISDHASKRGLDFLHPARFGAELGATVDALHWLARQDARIPQRLQ